MRVCLIANPFAASGKLGARLSWLESEARKRFPSCEIRTTRRRGDLADLSRGAAVEGFDRVVAVGGDGTINEVADGLHRAGATRSALGIIPMGTGSDFIRTIGVPKDPAAALDLLASTEPRAMDYGLAGFKDTTGASVSRAFVNIADFGLGGEVVERANRSPKWLGRFFTFYINTLISLFSYRPRLVRLSFDGTTEEKRITAVIIANGQYFGGGMRSAPKAKVDDGLFDLIVLDAMSPLTIARNLSKLYGATEVLNNPSVHFHRTRKIVVESSERTLIDLDGEQPGLLPATFEIIPLGMRVVRGR